MSDESKLSVSTDPVDGRNKINNRNQEEEDNNDGKKPKDEKVPSLEEEDDFVGFDQLNNVGPTMGQPQT
jgi:hypothetical protein